MRQKTGESAQKTGTYTFDGYLDGTWSPTPSANEHPHEAGRNAAAS